MFVYVSVSEFVEGGELHHLCETYGILPVIVVQIYIAEIALALGTYIYTYRYNVMCVYICILLLL